MNPLVIRNLSKRFNDTWAVRDLNLEIAAGDIFVLLGPNGAGKTTTLKLIAGLLHPTAGEIFLHGLSMRKESANAKSRLGFVPDEPFIYNKLTGREFINFIAGIFGVEKTRYDRMLPELIERFEIGEWIDQPAESYSHGMKQKVIMVQLLLHDPAVILIDEPLIGLDPKTSKTVRETFIRLAGQGKALLVSTHTLSFAREIATRIGIINYGELKFTGSIEELAEISGTEDIEEIYLRLSGDEAKLPDHG
jgi:ABC-2 type transport system ATP-binding protein